MTPSDRPTNTPKPSDFESDATGSEPEFREGRPRESEPGRASSPSDASDLEGGSDTPYRVGYKKPPVHSRFAKGHRGFKRRKPARAKPKGFIDEVLDELNRLVEVNENGRRYKSRGMKIGAKNMARAIIKGDAKTRAQLFQELRHAAAHSNVDLSLGPKEKPRRSHQQIMHDFAQDMYDETYEMLCEITGTTQFTDQQVFTRMEEIFREEAQKNPSDQDHSYKLLLFELLSMRQLQDYLAAVAAHRAERRAADK